MKVLSISTGGRTEFVNITARVAEAARELGVREGALTVFVPHTTAGVTTIDY
jgi:thiamine phosphate synthase YjbQ (UPF0047 family)